MLVIDGVIRMNDKEVRHFIEVVGGPYIPRTPAEFNAMCDLSIARHLHEDTNGLGCIFAEAIRAVKFGPDNKINFFTDSRRTDFAKVHGYWPSEEQLLKFEAGEMPAPAETVSEIRRRCSNAGLRLPATNTIRTRLERTKGRKRTLLRHGEAAAYAMHDPSLGSIPDADWPLSLVQIDHTLLPVIIVDDVHRKPINRAWITLAIDVNSRVCLGMYLTLDAPSAMSAGMCISHAILPKEAWLRRLNVTSVEWPVWGVMGVLHMDNAREFRGDMLKVACRQYDIDMHLRPVKKPRYGAHIERLMGTVTQGLKSIKGATFSGPQEKGEYDAEGNACMTFSEIERWLILFFAKYHIETHNGIGMSPLRKWREGLLGTKNKPGRGLPARRLDEEELRINFTPWIERTIQDYGVLIDDVHYYHDVLRLLIHFQT